MNEPRLKRFTLGLEARVADDALKDRLRDAGCNDAFIVIRDGFVTLDFDFRRVVDRAAVVVSTIEALAAVGVASRRLK